MPGFSTLQDKRQHGRGIETIFAGAANNLSCTGFGSYRRFGVPQKIRDFMAECIVTVNI